MGNGLDSIMVKNIYSYRPLPAFDRNANYETNGMSPIFSSFYKVPTLAKESVLTGQSNAYGYSKGNSQEINNCSMTIQAALKNINSLVQFKEDKNLSEATKQEIETLLNDAKNIEKISTEHSQSLNILMKVADKAITLDEKAAKLFVACQEEVTKALSGADNKTGGTNSSPATVGTFSIEPEEGDIKLSDEELAKRYGLNLKSKISVINNASDLASEICDQVNDTDDDDSRKAVVKYFGDSSQAGLVNANSIVQVLAKIDKEQDLKEFVEDIYDQDSGTNETSMRRVVTLLRDHLNNLVSSGVLKDSPDVEQKVSVSLNNINSYINDFDEHIKDISDVLSYCIGLLSPYSSSNAIIDVIKKNQESEKAEKTKEFFKEYAETTKNSDKPVTLDDKKTYALPQEIKYLPNKQVFKATINGKTFEGKDFKELNSLIFKSRDEAVLLKWIDVKNGLV